jgi:tight adherence protein B
MAGVAGAGGFLMTVPAAPGATADVAPAALTVLAPMAAALALRALHRAGAARRVARRLSPGGMPAHPSPAAPGARLVAAMRQRAGRAERRRLAAVERQLAEVLALQASALRAGHSVAGSLAAVAGEAGPPIGPELARCAAALGLGTPLGDALQRLERRCGPAAGPWVAALLAGSATGGDLARALESLAGRARARARLRGEVRALTAQGRLSGTVVSLAPVGFLALMGLASRGQAAALYGSAGGRAALLAGALLDLAGLLWIRRIVRIEL